MGVALGLSCGRVGGTGMKKPQLKHAWKKAEVGRRADVGIGGNRGRGEKGGMGKR